MTVRQLKNMIAEWPEEDESGEQAEVWIETGRQLSSICIATERLNAVDLLLTVGIYED